MAEPLPSAVPLTRGRGWAWVTAAYLCGATAAALAGWALAGRHPLAVAAAADVAATAVVFAFSVACDNSSLYDPYWSVAPIPLALYWAWGGALGWRPLLILGLISIWGARLTANWLVRWRGHADEDFRYQEIRAKTGRAYWPASFFAIHLFPTVWVFLGLLPIYPALARPATPLSGWDLLAAVTSAGAIVIEATADLQLRRFLRARPNRESILESGLWAFSRHPNYLGEILFWWGLFLFGVAADPAWAWSAVGPLAITALFAFVSAPWMDRRMLAGHPAFAARMKAVPALLPWRRSTNDR